jgi:two-component system, OmpR family, phosphate regulon response regulator PhoB
MPISTVAFKARRRGVQMGSRILIVEDSAVIRRLIEVCLRAADLEIITRDDGRTGLTAVSSESPDLVVLDIGLPGMDGWEVLDRIRKDETTKDIPVVVLTAHAEEESRRRANEGGADAFVTKPFQPNDFRSTVLSLLE